MSDPQRLPIPEDYPTQFVLSNGAIEQGGPSDILQLFVDMAPERGWVILKAHLVFWNTIAACLRRVGEGDDTAITLARSIEAAMKTPMEAYDRTATSDD